MPDMVVRFGKWLFAVVEHWELIVASGAIAFVIDLIDRFWEWRMPKKWYAWFVGVGLFLAMFAAWQDQYRDGESCRLTVKAAEQKVDDLSKPDLKATFFGEFMEGSDNSGNAALIFQLSVTDTGSPSTFSLGYGRVTLTNGKVIVLKELPRMFGQYVDFHTTPNQPFDVRLADADRLVLKSLSSPVERGGAASGWIGFVVPGISRSQMSKEGSEINVTFYDVNGKPFIAHKGLR
jgi:hypothetical protein